MCLTCSSSKKRRTAGSISSFSPLRLSAPGLVMMAPQRVITAGSSDEAAVRILLECRQHPRHPRRTVLERMLVIVVLPDGALVDGLAKLGALVMPLLRDLPGGG